MPRPSPFANRPKSKVVSRRRYPEEWAWWAASGWKMMVEEGDGGYAYLHSFRDNKGFTLWGATATPTETATPEAVRRFLTEVLYFHLHPRKARKAFDATGQVCTEKDLAAFIRSQRRKVAAALPSALKASQP